jgi:multiple sugar transport system substrate-binding protein
MAISRRGFLLGTGGLAAVATSGGLVGCAPGSKAAGGGAAAGTMALAFWGNPTRNKNTQDEIDAYVRAHPDVKIAGQPGDFASYWDKLATQTAGGTAPDIIQMDMAYIAEYGHRGALLDLSGVDTSKFVEGTVDSGKIDGKLVGINAGINSLVIMANPTLFE